MNFSYLLGLGGASRPEAPVVNTQSTRMIFTYTALSGLTGACVGVLHPQTRSNVLRRVNNHPRVGNDHTQTTAILGSGEKVGSFRHFYLRFQFFQIIPETMRQKDSANYLYSGAPYPTQSLKNLHRRKGGGCLGRYIKIYGALGTLYAKLTSNRIAANDC